MGLLDKLGRGRKERSQTVEDPVCGMRIDPAEAAGKSVHGRETYYFCCAGCKSKFDADPHAYLGAHGH